MADVPTRRIAVRIQPNAKTNEIVGERGGVIVIRVTAAAVEGKANAALIKYVAKKLGLPKSAVKIARGERGKEKLLEITGPEAANARQILLTGVEA